MGVKRDDRLVYADKMAKDENGELIISMSKSELYDYYKCANDILHFAENHAYVFTIDNGNQKIKLYDWQIKFLNNRSAVDKNGFPKYNYYLLMAGRRSGKTTSTAIWLLHKVLFSPKDLPKHVMLVCKTPKQSREILNMIKDIWVTLPKYLQRPITNPNAWKVDSIDLYNGTWIRMSTYFQADTVRGACATDLYCDELAFIPESLYETFKKAVFPTVTTGKNFTITFTSTPDGFNHFYKLYTKADKGENDYYPQKVIWSEIPEYYDDDGKPIYRGEDWKQEQILNISETVDAFLQEFQVEFLVVGGTGVFDIPENFFNARKQINSSNNVYKFWEHYDPNFFYTIGVDVGEGVGGDYSVIKVYKMKPINIDNNEYFYEEVASYRCNTIDTYNFASVIEEFDELYPNNKILVENNNHGHVTLQALLLRSANGTSNFDMDKLVNASDKRLGLMCTTKTKDLGFKTIKKLIKNNLIQINDTDTFTEISAYKGISHKYKEVKSDKELDKLKKRDGLKNQSSEHDDTVMASMWAVFIESEIPIMDEIYTFYKMTDEEKALTPEEILKKQDLFFLDEGNGIQSAKHNGLTRTDSINKFEGISIEAYDMYGNSLINMDEIEDFEDFEDTNYAIREEDANDMMIREYDLFKNAGLITNKKTPSVMDMYK